MYAHARVRGQVRTQKRAFFCRSASGRPPPHLLPLLPLGGDALIGRTVPAGLGGFWAQRRPGSREFCALPISRARGMASPLFPISGLPVFVPFLPLAFRSLLRSKSSSPHQLPSPSSNLSFPRGSFWRPEVCARAIHQDSLDENRQLFQNAVDAGDLLSKRACAVKPLLVRRLALAFF